MMDWKAVFSFPFHLKESEWYKRSPDGGASFAHKAPPPPPPPFRLASAQLSLDT